MDTIYEVEFEYPYGTIDISYIYCAKDEKDLSEAKKLPENQKALLALIREVEPISLKE